MTVWHQIIGTVVGYVHDSDEDNAQEHELMIVKAEAIDGRFADENSPHLPAFFLRWLGHDWEPARENVIDEAKVETGELIGMRIKFSTSAEEQEDYSRGWAKT